MSKITQASKVITQGTIDNLSLGNNNYFRTFFFQKQNMFAFSSCNMAGNIGSFQSICSLYFIFHLIKKKNWYQKNARILYLTAQDMHTINSCTL